MLVTWRCSYGAGHVPLVTCHWSRGGANVYAAVPQHACRARDELTYAACSTTLGQRSTSRMTNAWSLASAFRVSQPQRAAGQVNRLLSNECLLAVDLSSCA